MEAEATRRGRRLRALAKVCRESAQLDPLGRELLWEIESLAGQLFGFEDPEGTEDELRQRILRLRRESHEVSY